MSFDLQPTGSCTTTDTIVTCELGDLASGGNATVTIIVTARKAGTIVNTAEAHSASPDPNAANNTDAETTTVER
jgi:hypothetical protein